MLEAEPTIGRDHKPEGPVMSRGGESGRDAYDEAYHVIVVLTQF